MGSLTDVFDEFPYHSDLKWHKPKDVRIALEELEFLSPRSPRYDTEKCAVLHCVGANAMEQFAKGKQSSGMETKMFYDVLVNAIEATQEAAGVNVTSTYL